MTGTSTLPSPPIRPVPSRSLAGPAGSSDPERRQQLLDQAAALDSRAKAAAERGDTDEAARLILESLEFERRAGGLGPQVLQLIKPRG
ncbi:MAG: hypothetical protein ACK55E_04675 [Cyanobacteriota bacterium]|jgi:hypothetical protein